MLYLGFMAEGSNIVPINESARKFLDGDDDDFDYEQDIDQLLVQLEGYGAQAFEAMSVLAYFTRSIHPRLASAASLAISHACLVAMEDPLATPPA